MLPTWVPMMLLLEYFYHQFYCLGKLHTPYAGYDIFSDLPKKLMLDSLSYLTPHDIDCSLRFISRECNEEVEESHDELPKHSILLTSYHPLKQKGLLHPTSLIAYFIAYPSTRQWKAITVEELQGRLASERLGRVALLKLVMDSESEANFINFVVEEILKNSLPVQKIELGPAPSLREQKLLATATKKAIRELKPSCLMALHTYKILNKKLYPLLCTIPHFVYKFAFTDSPELYHEMLDFLFEGGHKGRVIFHLERLLNGDSAIVHRFLQGTLQRFLAIRSSKELHFPEGGFLFMHIDDFSPMTLGGSGPKPCLEVVFDKLGVVPYATTCHINDSEPVREPLACNCDYYAKLKNTAWKVWQVKNSYLADGSDDGRGKHMRVMQKVEGCSEVSMAIHLQIFDD